MTRKVVGVNAIFRVLLFSSPLSSPPTSAARSHPVSSLSSTQHHHTTPQHNTTQLQLQDLPIVGDTTIEIQKHNQNTPPHTTHPSTAPCRRRQSGRLARNSAAAPPRAPPMLPPRGLPARRGPRNWRPARSSTSRRPLPRPPTGARLPCANRPRPRAPATAHPARAAPSWEVSLAPLTLDDTPTGAPADTAQTRPRSATTPAPAPATS